MKSNIFKMGILTVVFGIGFFGFLLLAGDDEPSNPLPFGLWLLYKGLGGGLIYAAIQIGKWLNRSNLLPDSFRDLKDKVQ